MLHVDSSLPRPTLMLQKVSAMAACKPSHATEAWTYCLDAPSWMPAGGSCVSGLSTRTEQLPGMFVTTRI